MEGTPFGRYRLVDLLGRGGMGEVWRAHDTRTDRIVAIKVLPAHFSDDTKFQQRFRREAHAAARLDSPHIIPIHDYGEIDGRLYVDMRLIRGHDLHTVLASGPIEVARAIRIVEQVAKALHAAHRVGLVHRDVKPSNILLDEDDFAYLIDFGIARAADDTRMTGTGNAMGTFQYIAPERLGDHPHDDARTDIYALACVLYECLTGQPPFAGTSMGSLVAAHLNTPPPQPSTSQPNLPKQVDEVIATGMAKDPDERYTTTVELANAARDAITVPVQRPTPSPASTRSRPTPAAAAEQQGNEIARQPTRKDAPAAPTPGLNDAPTQDASTEPAAVHGVSPAIQVPEDIVRRPKAVTAAVVIAGLWAALLALVGTLGLIEGFNSLGNTRWQYGTILLILGAASLTVAAVLVWGAVAAFRGVSKKAILFAPGIVAMFLAAATAVGLAIGDDAWEPAVLLIYPLILLLPSSLLILTRSSRDFFHAQSQGRLAAPPWRRKPAIITAVLAIVTITVITIVTISLSRPDNALPFSGLKDPTKVAVGPDNSVYVTDGRVLKLSSGATTQTELPFGLTSPVGVAVGVDNTVYVADVNNSRVMKLPPGATTPVELPFGLPRPLAVAVGADNAVYATDTSSDHPRVMKLPPGATTPVELPFTGLSYPQGVAVGADNTVYVAEYGGGRVLKLPPGATTQTELFTGLGSPDVAVGADNTVYVTGKGRVMKLPPGATTPVELPSNGINRPQGVAVWADNTVYVEGRDNYGNPRVFKLTAGSAP